MEHCADRLPAGWSGGVDPGAGGPGQPAGDPRQQGAGHPAHLHSQEERPPGIHQAGGTTLMESALFKSIVYK